MKSNADLPQHCSPQTTFAASFMVTSEQGSLLQVTCLSRPQFPDAELQASEQQPQCSATFCFTVGFFGQLFWFGFSRQSFSVYILSWPQTHRDRQPASVGLQQLESIRSQWPLRPSRASPWWHRNTQAYSVSRWGGAGMGGMR